jgi:hypothetical protein
MKMSLYHHDTSREEPVVTAEAEHFDACVANLLNAVIDYGGPDHPPLPALYTALAEWVIQDGRDPSDTTKSESDWEMSAPEQAFTLTLELAPGSWVIFVHDPDDGRHKLPEGPWESKAAALHFAEAEVGMPYEIVPADDAAD